MESLSGRDLEDIQLISGFCDPELKVRLDVYGDPWRFFVDSKGNQDSEEFHPQSAKKNDIELAVRVVCQRGLSDWYYSFLQSMEDPDKNSTGRHERECLRRNSSNRNKTRAVCASIRQELGGIDDKSCYEEALFQYRKAMMPSKDFIKDQERRNGKKEKD